jgi:hypothetical protein
MDVGIAIVSPAVALRLEAKLGNESEVASAADFGGLAVNSVALVLGAAAGAGCRILVTKHFRKIPAIEDESALQGASPFPDALAGAEAPP